MNLDPRHSKTSKEYSGEEGRTTFETRMKWSPAKRVGQKRSIEALEVDEGRAFVS